MPLTEEQKMQHKMNQAESTLRKRRNSRKKWRLALKAKKPRKRNCEELERACAETRTSLCHNEKHKPHYSHYWIQSSGIPNSQVDVPLTSHQQSYLCFVRWQKKESIRNMKPAASSSTFATFYTVSSPPGRFNLGGPVPILINRQSMQHTGHD
jgi:hypothetical protein